MARPAQIEPESINNPIRRAGAIVRRLPFTVCHLHTTHISLTLTCRLSIVLGQRNNELSWPLLVCLTLEGATLKGPLGLKVTRQRGRSATTMTMTLSWLQADAGGSINAPFAPNQLGRPKVTARPNQSRQQPPAGRCDKLLLRLGSIGWRQLLI